MLKIGIIGAGRIGKVHSESITYHVKDAEVAAIADPFMNEATENWAKSLGIPVISKDYHDILNDPAIDAVLICSSTDTHADISIEAIKASTSMSRAPIIPIKLFLILKCHLFAI